MHLSLNVHTSQNITDAPWRLHVSQTEGLQLWEGMTLTTENKIGLTNGQTVTATISDTPNLDDEVRQGTRFCSETVRDYMLSEANRLSAATSCPSLQAVRGYKLSAATSCQALHAVRSYRLSEATGCLGLQAVRRHRLSEATGSQGLQAV